MSKTIVILFKLGPTKDANQFRLVVGKHPEVQVGDALGEPTWVPASQSADLDTEKVVTCALRKLIEVAADDSAKTRIQCKYTNSVDRVTIDLGLVNL